MRRLREDIVRLSSDENTIISELSGKIEKRETLSNAERDELYSQWEKGNYYGLLQDKLTEYVNKSI